jgi:phosphatidylserine/phosphatidylglycerophosphate/cardiolipin synthase-like enzyme
VNGLRPLPAGLDFEGAAHPAPGTALLRDLTWVEHDETGAGPARRRTDQEIFPAMFDLIAQARTLVVLDMFLYNPYMAGNGDGVERPLTAELTDLLVARKAAHPALRVVVITDPINSFYGSLQPVFFNRLREAGVELVETRLDALPDSNPAYSAIWRLFLRPFGNGDPGAGRVPSPFGTEPVSLRSYLALLNFKANHRKVLIVDSPDGLVGVVGSANPHDGSSAHANAAVRFRGPAVLDLLACEQAVLDFSAPDLEPLAGTLAGDPALAPAPAEAELRVQVLTEKAIERRVLLLLNRAGAGDAVDLVMFYLSDRDVVRGLRRAAERGARVRVLLDPNRDAFGRVKNGIPNRQVGYELHRAGLPVRWADTHGEQCHTKLLCVRWADGESAVVTGSANFTRRNLENLNLETSVCVRGPDRHAFFRDVNAYVDLLWKGDGERRFSLPYEAFADGSLRRRLIYRFQEWSGFSTF